MAEKTYHYTAGDTAEHVVTNKRCRLHSLRPNLTTTGTITLREGPTTGGSSVFSISAIGLLQAGKSFDGVVLPNGFTVQLSAATDLSCIVYETF